MGEKKLHSLKFKLKGIGGNMRCKLLRNRSTGKTTECFKLLQHIATEKDNFLELNRCIFQISLMFMKLAIQEILFMLVLCNFKFYLKIMSPPTKLTPPII